MIIIEPTARIECAPSTNDAYKVIEAAARTCYKSDCSVNAEGTEDFVRRITQVKKHVSVIEHVSATVRFICDRGVTHELVRHRIAAFSQESTRYCNYSKDKFGKQITVIRPLWWNEGDPQYDAWKAGCEACEKAYFTILAQGGTPQQARAVLPNSLKTELVMTCNMREWRHVFALRAASSAHPQMVQLVKDLLVEFKARWPALFEDINPV